MKRALGLAVLFALSGCTCWSDYSDGERVGVVQKLSRKGMFCKTWEGEMLLGGMREQSTGGEHPSTYMAPNLWQFTVRDRDEALLKQVQEAMKSGEAVGVHYHQDVTFGTPCSTETGYFVTEIDSRS